MTTRQLRLLRAAAVSSVATLIAAVSHTLGGGTAPHPLLILAVAVLFLPPTAVLLGTRRSRTRVSAAVLLAQGAFHLLFQVLGAPTAGTTAAIGAHSHHLALPVLTTDPSVPPLDAPMVLAHLVAALLTAALVWHAEGMAHTIAVWFQKLLRRADTSSSPTHRHPSPLRSLLLTPRDAAVRAGVSLRGPPALARG